MLFFHWFYKVVREKCCFYIGFTRVVREKPHKTCVKSIFFVDNPPGTVSPRGAGPKLPFLLQNRIASRSPTQLRLASPARTHERNETISRLAVSQLTHPPNLQYIYDANFMFPDLRKWPRGGFWYVEFNVELKNKRFLQPVLKNNKNKLKRQNLAFSKYFYAQTLILVNLILVNCFGFWVITRTPVAGFGRKLDTWKLPASRTFLNQKGSKKQQENQNVRPRISTKNRKMFNEY